MSLTPGANLSQNQFAQAPVQGMMDQIVPGNTITVQVVSTQVVPLVAGQAVKLVDIAGGVPVVSSLATDADEVFGFVSYNLKDASYPARAKLELATQASIMWMESGAAIARGAKVEVNNADVTVITNAGVNPVSGFAFDKATAANQLIRVWILTPGFQLAQVIGDIAGLQAALDALTLANDADTKTTVVTATLAEINAGKVLVAGVAGKSITVTSLTRRVVGAAAAATSADVQSDATNVKVMVDQIAGLTNGAVIINDAATSIPGAGWGVPLPVAEGLKVVDVGAPMTTLTSIKYTISYKQSA